jgi:hypothetical protein
MQIEGTLVRDQGDQLLEFDAFPQLPQPSSHLMVEVEHFCKFPQLIAREVPSLTNLREDLEQVRRLPVDFVNKEFGFAKQAMLEGTLQILKETLRLLSVDVGHEFSAEEVEGVIPLV